MNPQTFNNLYNVYEIQKNVHKMRNIEIDAIVSSMQWKLHEYIYIQYRDHLF